MSSGDDAKRVRKIEESKNFRIPRDSCQKMIKHFITFTTFFRSLKLFAFNLLLNTFLIKLGAVSSWIFNESSACAAIPPEAYAERSRKEGANGDVGVVEGNFMEVQS